MAFKLSTSTVASALDGTEKMPARQGSNQRHITPSLVRDYILSNTLAVAQGAITTSAPALNATQTWNDGAVTFTGMKVNVTDTDSASASMLFDFQVGGASKLNLTKAGQLNALNIMDSASNAFYLSTGNGYNTRSAGYFGFTATTNAVNAVDTYMKRAAAGIVTFEAASSAGGAIQLKERTAPSAPSADNVILYAVDNGGGKTQLMALFSSGAAQQVAIQP